MHFSERALYVDTARDKWLLKALTVHVKKHLLVEKLKHRW